MAVSLESARATVSHTHSLDWLSSLCAHSRRMTWKMLVAFHRFSVDVSSLNTCVVDTNCCVVQSPHYWLSYWYTAQCITRSCLTRYCCIRTSMPYSWHVPCGRVLASCAVPVGTGQCAWWCTPSLHRGALPRG